MKKILVTLLIIIAIFGIVEYNLYKTPKDVTKASLEIDGLQRYYYLHLPKNYSESQEYPLVFVFHGGGSNAKNIMKGSEYNQEADLEKFIVVYPQGTGKSSFLGPSGTWNAGPKTGGYAVMNNVNDTKFFDSMYEQITSKYKINKQKVFSTGISMGGMFSYRLACERSDKIKGIAPVGSTITLDNCNPENPVSIIHFHGTADKFVPFEGGNGSETVPLKLIVGQNYPSEKETIALWTKLNNCSNETKIIFEKDDIQCTEYFECEKNTKITSCVINNGGHNWPGSEPVKSSKLKEYLGETTQTISATNMSWEFFN